MTEKDVRQAAIEAFRFAGMGHGSAQGAAAMMLDEGQSFEVAAILCRRMSEQGRVTPGRIREAASEFAKRPRVVSRVLASGRTDTRVETAGGRVMLEDGSLTAGHEDPESTVIDGRRYVKQQEYVTVAEEPQSTGRTAWGRELSEDA